MNDDEGAHRLGVGDEDPQQRQQGEREPQRRGPELQALQRAHAVDDDRDHDHGRDEIAEPTAASPIATCSPCAMMAPSRAKKMQVKPAKITVVIDRAVVAESRATGDEIEVEVVAGGVVGDGHADDEDDDRREQDAEHGVGRCRGRCRCSRRSRNRRGTRWTRGRSRRRRPRSSAGRCAARSGRRSPRGCPPRPRARCLSCSQWHPLTHLAWGILRGPVLRQHCGPRKPVMSAQIAMAARTVEVAAEPPSPVLRDEARGEHDVAARRPRGRSRCAARRAAR